MVKEKSGNAQCKNMHLEVRLVKKKFFFNFVVSGSYFITKPINSLLLSS